MPSVIMTIAALAATTSLQPTSKWQVNFDDSQCAATREFGTAAAPLTLVFKAPVTGDVLQLAVATSKLGVANPTQLKAKIAWGSGEPTVTSTLTYRAQNLKRQMYLLNLPRDKVLAATAAGQTDLTLTGLETDYHFTLSSFANVLSVMDDCVKGLRTYWNFHDDKLAGEDLFKRRAKTSLPALFTSDDYPAEALSNNQDGEVRVVLLINPDGKVADCTLTQTSGVASLDAQTCAIIRSRAKYQPALGPDGKPARDTDYARIRWVVPID